MNLSSLIGHTIELLKLIDASHQPADRTTSSFFRERKYLGAQDRRTISETIYGMIRHRRLIEALLEQYLTEYPSHQALDDRTLRYLPLFAAYAIALEGANAEQSSVPPSLWETNFPDIDLQSYTGWLQKNLALGFLGPENIIRLGVKYSFQDWMVEEWLGQVGDQTEQFLQSLNKPASTNLRVNFLKTTREECQLRLSKEGIETTTTELSPSGLRALRRFNAQSLETFKDGWFELQDEGSQAVSLIANPQPGNIIIDACAGAGGKSLHMAELMRGEGEIIAIDVDGRRLSELQRRAERAGAKIIKTILREDLQPENLAGKADLVLVDAPCSGTGTIRRNPWFKWSVSESVVQHFSELQREILSYNAQFVKAGGRILYVTCSLLRSENEAVVEQFLSSHPGFHRSDLIADTYSRSFPMHDGCLKLYPHRYDTDGFVMHQFQKE